MENDDYEQLLLCQDRSAGLKAVIAIHDTTLGPALGGTRMWPYGSEDAAIEDALRLAKGMTYKNAASGLNLGGGKAVIFGDANKDKSEEMFRSFGRYIQRLNGRFITAEDVGTTVEDMEMIRQETAYVTGISAASGASGDPSPVTAYGVYQGMKAAAQAVFGSSALEGKTVAVQGAGHVAYYLCKHLHEEGARLVVTDINKQALERITDDFGATAVAPDDIYSVDCDIFAPCALGAIINDQTILQLKAKIIAGSANNQLQNESHGDQLQERNIAYVPDYVINAGGVINISDELNGYNHERAIKKVEGIYDNVFHVFKIAERDQVTTQEAANKLAEERIERIKN